MNESSTDERVKILGLDPGLANLGWGVIEHPEVSNAAIVSGSVSTQSRTPLPERLNAIYDAVAEAVETHKPDAAAVEEVFFSNNSKTVIAMAQARGVALLALARAGVTLYEYSPLQIKQSVVGYGRASKDQVQSMVTNLLGLDGKPASEHAADALAAALCHAASLKRRALIGNAMNEQILQQTAKSRSRGQKSRPKWGGKKQ